MASVDGRPWMMQGRPVVNRTLDANLVLDGALYQLWEGFGGGLSEMGWEALQSLSGPERKRAVNTLFAHEDEGCRFHYARIPVGASNLALAPYSHNDAAGDVAMKRFSVARDRERLIPFLRLPLARIRKFKVLACPWSPPAWMMAGAGGGGSLVWTTVMLEAYALYLARFVEAYRDEGITIDHLMIQNEPSSPGRRPGCVWTGAQLRDFIRSYLGPMLAKRRVPVKLWLGALGTEGYDEIVQAVLSDRLAMRFLSGVACQRGGRSLLGRIRRAFADLPLMLSDCGEGDGANTWAQAHDTFRAVHQAVTSGACACLHDNLVFPQGGSDLEGCGRNSLLAVNRESRSFAVTPDYHVFRHLSGLTDRYAVRMGLSGAWADRALAFFNESDESRILVVHNPEPESRRVVLDDGGRKLVLMLPPDSFNTIVV